MMCYEDKDKKDRQHTYIYSENSLKNIIFLYFLYELSKNNGGNT